MKKADGWSMGQEEQKKKALEEKLRRRVYTAAFEAAQQRKEKPWQSWDEAFSERLAKQPFITEEERKPFAPSGAGAQNAFYTGEKQPWPGLGEAWPGQARRAERTPWAALSENPPSGAGTMLLAGQRRSMAQATPGGHTATGDVDTPQGSFAIDTGFIGYNDRTYPRFMGLLSELGICGQKTQMSFSVHNPQSGLEYNGHTLTSLFAQRRNLLNPAFWTLLKEIVRFNRLAKQTLRGEVDGSATLETFLRQHRFTPFFARHYILPMGAAIWSSSLQEMKRFPLPLFLRFFENHGLLDITHRPQWYVVPGGSREYIRAMMDKLGDRLTLHLNAPVQKVVRHDRGVDIEREGVTHTFDQVIFACHSAQALAMLASPTQAEREVLGDIGWQRNEVVLHSDPRWLPVRKRAWASWNYRLSEQDRASACVTYNMNILQGLPPGSPLFCVTLNPETPVEERYVLRRFVYEHPLFNPQSWQAQARRGEINGRQRSWFCGAYWYNGFHEDGVRSALDVVNAIATGEGN